MNEPDFASIQDPVVRVVLQILWGRTAETDNKVTRLLWIATIGTASVLGNLVLNLLIHPAVTTH